MKVQRGALVDIQAYLGGADKERLLRKTGAANPAGEKYIYIFFY